jgi:protein-L-isoaspartate(D-aspartate) O-methyltransferase
MGLVDISTDELRRQMVVRLRRSGVVVTTAVEDAMHQIPRDLFVSHVDIQCAYDDRALPTKLGDDGTPISSASQPTIVATMLEQLQISQGNHVLEIGTGTGYNAALLATLAGSRCVVSVELELDLAEQAEELLSRLGLDVQVVVGDGRSGYQPSAPYDRIVVTTGAREIASAWMAQLGNGGRLVVPIVDEDGVGSIQVFEKLDDALLRRAAIPCGFLPIRSASNG